MQSRKCLTKFLFINTSSSLYHTINYQKNTIHNIGNIVNPKSNRNAAHLNELYITTTLQNNNFTEQHSTMFIIARQYIIAFAN